MCSCLILEDIGKIEKDIKKQVADLDLSEGR